MSAKRMLKYFTYAVILFGYLIISQSILMSVRIAATSTFSSLYLCLPAPKVMLQIVSSQNHFHQVLEPELPPMLWS